MLSPVCLFRPFKHSETIYECQPNWDLNRNLSMKGNYLNILKRYLKKMCWELVVEVNLTAWKQAIRKQKRLVSFFYNSKLGSNGKFDPKELGNYRITYAFSRLSF